MPARLTEEPESIATRYALILQTLTPYEIPKYSTSSPSSPTQTVSSTKTPSPEDLAQLQSIYLHPGLPKAIFDSLNLDHFSIRQSSQENIGNVQLEALSSSIFQEDQVIWVYTLISPFFSIPDEVSINALQLFWDGQPEPGFPFAKLFVTEATRSAMSEVLGEPDDSTVQVIESNLLNQEMINRDDSLAIIPFEELIPQYKVLRVEGSAPIDFNFDPYDYSLSVRISLSGSWPQKKPILPPCNYDPNHKTVVIMTGVTALTRATAFQMATRGETFPGVDIQPWLLNADITHISHEVPFSSSCPYPDPIQEDLIFCAAPERIDLFDYIDADIVELSGNHLLDYGESAASLTLQMYEQRGILTYAGGSSLAKAQSALQIIHNGNRIAFIGCNAPGPPNVWATDTKPGAVPCGDYLWLEEEILRNQKEGYLPIVTLQYTEDYSAYPSQQMQEDFINLADAGAVVVNGSQAHTPKIMGFYQNSFLHFGLGNLFFDQMEVFYGDTLMEGTRDEFIDRLVFYDNRLISVELLTAKLEDYARPRPMTPQERQNFLTRIFIIAKDTQIESGP